jgi:hypothetical protein
MANQKVQLADVIVPEVFEQYVIERSAEKTNFYDSGIVQRTPEFDALASGPGRMVDMPFWKDLVGPRQILSDTNAIETRKIVSGKDTARIHNDANSWSVTLLATLMAGDDAMERIIDLVADYWARETEAMLVSTIKGVLAAFDAEAGDPNLLKIASESAASGATTTANVLNGINFIEAKQKLGDAKDQLVAIAVHSDVEADLLKQDEIQFIPSSEGKDLIKTFKGLRVIMDDNLPKRPGTTSGWVYTSVLFGNAAVASGFATLDKPIPGGFGTEGVEFARVSLNSDDVLINRRRFILHPRGVRWTEANVAEAGGPTNAELENANNWQRVYDPKNIRIVGIVHNLSSQIS